MKPLPNHRKRRFYCRRCGQEAIGTRTGPHVDHRPTAIKSGEALWGQDDPTSPVDRAAGRKLRHASAPRRYPSGLPRAANPSQTPQAPPAYSAHREHGFQAIVNAVGGSAAEAADIGSSVHDEIDNGRIPAMTCSDSPLISQFLVSTPPALTAASTSLLTPGIDDVSKSDKSPQKPTLRSVGKWV